MKHKEVCPARNVKYNKCGKARHIAKVCKSSEDIRQVEPENEREDDGVYNINLFRIKTSARSVKPRLSSSMRDKNDFKTQLVVNNCLDTVIIDTGAQVSVCGTVQAKKWNMLGKMIPSKVRIKPYKSTPIPVHGQARCAVTFGQTSVPVMWHIISGSCEPIIARKMALQLDKEVKPVHVPPRSFPYHLKERGQKEIEDMIEQDVIEEHPRDEPAPWVANAVLAPKDDGSLWVTMDARNVSKALYPTNHPIARHEDIKAKLSGCRVFSKMDFKSAFWQIELEPESRYLTVFHANYKLYRYKRLTMGLQPSQGELNAGLLPVLAHIPNAHLIHDDLIVDRSVDLCMQAISDAGITLNAKKCQFGRKKISFWGMIYGEDGVKPDPSKVEALVHLTAPTSKEELISFLCMMQSNSEFVPNFAQRSAKLRELTKGRARFVCSNEHQKGSIRIDRTKLPHQDVRYEVVYQEGKLNQVDFTSRKAKPLQMMTNEEREEAEELNNLLYMLHTTPIMDSIGIGNIAMHTKIDETLTELAKIIQNGRKWIPKTSHPKVRSFEQIIPEITIAENGVMFKGERIILPESLQDTAIQLAHEEVTWDRVGLKGV
ncbi:Hypothetical predicted protein [Paramuricea clavata]|uniref:Reverse transcriptase domain-containing protein n=1 Tax=Paramuricea clavata TaxID=317549 RepID=A0A6S7GIV0_PARCT|nr:Hypothetical predicted protein [Paramuricea clavata]